MEKMVSARKCRREAVEQRLQRRGQQLLPLLDKRRGRRCFFAVLEPSDEHLPNAVFAHSQQQGYGRFKGTPLEYYTEAKEKDRTYYEVCTLPGAEEVPEEYRAISFVSLRPDGAIETPGTVSIMCRQAKKKAKGLEDFHFHMLRPTFTSNLLSNGAAPKDVQELLGRSDVSTTMNIYAHSTREAERTSARLLDKAAGGKTYKV